jgi:hypothetical protein
MPFKGRRYSSTVNNGCFDLFLYAYRVDSARYSSTVNNECFNLDLYAYRGDSALQIDV